MVRVFFYEEWPTPSLLGVGERSEQEAHIRRSITKSPFILPIACDNRMPLSRATLKI
jgi:hypothetical protein